MATAISRFFKVGGLDAITPTQFTKGADVTIAAGANGVIQFAPDGTNAQAGPVLVIARLRFKAYGTVLTSLQPVLADNAALTTNPVNAGSPLITTSLPASGTTATEIIVWALSDRATTQYFGLLQSGTLTGSYTLDYSYEFYPVSQAA